MKTETLLFEALMIGIPSVYCLILWLSVVIAEERKGKGRFFYIIKTGLFKEKSPPVIVMVIWIMLSIIGLIWSLTTILGNIWRI